MKSIFLKFSAVFTFLIFLNTVLLSQNLSEELESAEATERVEPETLPAASQMGEEIELSEDNTEIVTPENEANPASTERVIPEVTTEESEPVNEIDPEDYRLANPDLVDQYTRGDINFSYPEHFMINIFMGAFSGAAIGSLIGLTAYDSNNTTKSNESILLYTGALTVTGALAGSIVSWVEYSERNQFTIGPVVMNYAWYGALGGALAGAAAGLIPYSSSQNSDDIINYTGYGAGAGFITSMVLFFVQMPENLELTLGPVRGSEMGAMVSRRF